MTEAINDKKHNVFLSVLLGGVIIAITVSFYNFYFRKNYDFFIETSCDPSSEECFYRDCVNEPDVCPPNNLSYYSKYTIKARDFKYCPNEDCTETCKKGIINCVQTACSAEEKESGSCTIPPIEGAVIINE